MINSNKEKYNICRKLTNYFKNFESTSWQEEIVFKTIRNVVTKTNLHLQNRQFVIPVDLNCNSWKLINFFEIIWQNLTRDIMKNGLGVKKWRLRRLIIFVYLNNQVYLNKAFFCEKKFSKNLIWSRIIALWPFIVSVY